MIKKQSIYLTSLRAYSFPLSISSALIGPAWAYSEGYKIDTLSLILLCIAVLLYHGAVNMLNDYFDYKKGVDKNERQLVVNKKTPQFLLHYAVALFAFGTICGLILFFLSGLPLLIMGIAGALLSLLYTGKKFSLKYIAMGEVTVFITFGPLLGAASFYAVTSIISAELILLTSATGFFAALVLFLNNMRDIRDDIKAGIITLPMLMKEQTAKRVAMLILFLPYVIIIVATALDIFPIFVLLSLTSVFFAAKVFKTVFDKTATANYDKALMNTIKVHTIFAISCIAGLTLPALIRRLIETLK
ncbi:MAG: prenyltransferase [Spirochaetes bacterium]|jgi:1,4-dihydroxy-2-naphthoate octaprenyltransferase|nr:prenyltransferase [Spirochaetota bacterium]